MNKVKQVLSSNKLCYLIDVVMIVLGIYGVMAGLTTSLYFPQSAIYGVYLLIVVGILFYSLCFFLKQKLYLLTFISELFLLLFILIAYLPEISLMLERLLRVIQYNDFLRFDNLILATNEDIMIIIFVCFIGIPIVSMIVSVINRGQRLFIKLFTILLLMIFPVLIKHDISVLTSYCVVLFLLYAYVCCFGLRNQKRNFVVKVIVVGTLSFALVFSSFFLEPNPIFKENASSVLTNISNWIDESRFQSIGDGMKQTGASSTVDGSLPTNSVRLNNDVALTVKSPISMSTYLRGYSLAHYDNNAWHPVKENYAGENSMQFYPNYLSSMTEGEYSASVEIDSRKKTSYQFVPYYSLMNDPLIDDSYYKNTNLSIKVIYDRDEAFKNYLLRGSSQEHPQYSFYAGYEYTDVPIRLRETIENMIASEYKEEYSQLIAGTTQKKIDIVKDILNRRTSYDLSAGVLPNGKDFVEYFLMESKKGSCTHYATAAALMLRCFGVPARYTSGFIMNESDFQDGVATIRNSRAHAWIEVYYDGLGWFPYEVTPSGNDTSENSADAIGSMLDQRVREQSLEPPDESLNTSEQTLDNNEGNNSTERETKISWDEFLINYSLYIAIVIGVIAILGLYRFITKKYFLILLRNKGPNEKIIFYYQRMKRMTHFCGQIDSSIHSIALKAKFSQYRLDDEVKDVEAYYEVLNKDIYKNLAWYKKLIYKYIFGYI